MDQVKRLLAWWKKSRLGRTLTRYGTANGALLSGGISFSALFSIFAALTIGFTAFMAVLGNNTELRDAVLNSLDDALPGIIDTGDGNGLITPEQLELSTAGGIVGIIAIVILLNTATTVMTALRRGIRAMFGLVSPDESPVVGKLRDLASFLALAAAVVLTAAVGLAAGAMADTLLNLIGLQDATFTGGLLRGLGLVIALAMDTVVFMVLYRFLAGARPPRRDLFTGALIAGIGAGVLRLLGTTLVSSVSDNPLLASYAAIATLLLWVNLAVRITLIAAAWTANPPPPLEITDEMVTHFDEAPNYVTVSDPQTLQWDHDPSTGQIRPEVPEEDKYWGGLIGWVRDTIKAGKEGSDNRPPGAVDAEELNGAEAERSEQR